LAPTADRGRGIFRRHGSRRLDGPIDAESHLSDRTLRSP
jgi:hypothetical protein